MPPWMIMILLNKSIQNNNEGLIPILQAFDEMGIKYAISQTNFIFADLENLQPPFLNALLREGIIIRPLGPRVDRTASGLQSGQKNKINVL